MARSHWKGDLESGEFSERHEPMTEELQLIYNSMTAHVAKARNWRDYSRVEEWQWFAFFRLVETSGLRFNEERNNPSGYYYRAINTDFLRCLNKFKEELDIDKLNAMSERVIMKSSFQGVY